MHDIADGAQASPSQERPTGELVRQLSEQVSVLVREELKLAQLEMTRKGKQAGVGAGMLGGGGMIALYAIGCLIACVILAISGVLAAWLSALIVGGALLAVAGAVALVGKSRLEKGHPSGPEGRRRQRQDRRRSDQGEGAAVTTSGRGRKATTEPRADPETVPDGTVPGDEQELRQEIEQTREQVDETVKQLVAKTDLKGRARAKAARLTGRVKGSTARLRAQTAERGAGMRSQVAGKTATARQKAAAVGGTAKSQLEARGAPVWEATSEPVRRTAVKGAV